MKCKCASFCAMFVQNDAAVEQETCMAQDNGDVLLGTDARLAIVRNEVGISQAAMADVIGVSHRAYHRYEKGKRGIPDEALIALDRRYEVDVA